VAFFLEVAMASPPSTAPAILIVEDDAIARAGLDIILTRAGYHPVSVSEGGNAIALVRAGLTPVLILLDMFLPGIDGWKFCKIRQQHPVLAQIPVVIMTGLSTATDEWAAALGAVALLRKPIDVERLVSIVRTWSQSEPSRVDPISPANL
jgi:CheY-like chemotaxis protein